VAINFLVHLREFVGLWLLPYDTKRAEFRSVSKQWLGDTSFAWEVKAGHYLTTAASRSDRGLNATNQCFSMAHSIAKACLEFSSQVLPPE
jgi:hypothetical protein